MRIIEDWTKIDDAELISTIMGIPEDTGKRIMDRFSSFRGIANQPMEKFLDFKGVGDGKIMRLGGAFELARRIVDNLIRKGDLIVPD